MHPDEGQEFVSKVNDENEALSASHSHHNGLFISCRYPKQWFPPQFPSADKWPPLCPGAALHTDVTVVSRWLALLRSAWRCTGPSLSQRGPSISQRGPSISQTRKWRRNRNGQPGLKQKPASQLLHAPEQIELASSEEALLSMPLFLRRTHWYSQPAHRTRCARVRSGCAVALPSTLDRHCLRNPLDRRRLRSAAATTTVLRAPATHLDSFRR